MRIIEKIDGKEVVESISFSDRYTISINLYSNLTQNIYDSLMDYQKDMIDEYLSQKYPNGFDEIGFEEFVKFELENVLKEKDEYLIYPGFLSFDDKNACDNFIDEIKESIKDIDNILEDLDDNGYDTTHWSFIKLSELSYILENEVLEKIKDLKETMSIEDFNDKKAELNAIIDGIITNQINSDGMDYFLKTTHYEPLEDAINEVLDSNQKATIKALDFLKDFTLKELQEFSPKGKEQDEILYIKDYVNNPKAIADFKKYLENHKGENYETAENLLEYFKKSERERYIQEDLMENFKWCNVKDKHLLDRLYFEIYSDSKEKVAEHNAENNFFGDIGYDSPCECNVTSLRVDNEDYTAISFVTNSVSSWGMQSSANWTDCVFFKGTILDLQETCNVFLASEEWLNDGLIGELVNDTCSDYDSAEEFVNNLDYNDVVKAIYKKDFYNEKLEDYKKTFSECSDDLDEQNKPRKQR